MICSSIVDGLQSRDGVLHCQDFLRGVALPIQVFADDAQRIFGAVGLRGITRKLPVGHIGVVHERAGRFDHVDPLPPVALCQFRPPGRREHGLAKVDRRRSPFRIVGGIAALKHIPGL